MLFNGSLQVFGGHAGILALDRKSVDLLGQLLQRVTLEHAAALNARFQLFGLDEGVDHRLGEQGIGGDESAVDGRVGAHVAAIALVDVAVAVIIHVDHAVGGTGEGPYGVAVQHAGVRIGPGIALDVAHLGGVGADGLRKVDALAGGGGLDVGGGQVGGQVGHLGLAHIHVGGEAAGGQNDALPGLDGLVAVGRGHADAYHAVGLIAGTVDFHHLGFQLDDGVGILEHLELKIGDIGAHLVFRHIGAIAIVSAGTGQRIANHQAVVQQQVQIVG